MEQLQNQINDIREKNKIEVEYSKLNNRKIKQSEIIECMPDYSIFEILPYLQKLRINAYVEYDNNGYICLTDTGVRYYGN